MQDAYQTTAGPPLAVLNPGGRDSFVDYTAGPGAFSPAIHPPVNFHAYAAATGGAFCQSLEQVLESGRFRHCLVLLRRRLDPSRDALRRLKESGLRVWVAWKECGAFQISEQLADARLWDAYAEILSLCDAVVTPTLVPPPLPPGIKEPRLLGIPTPYPVDFPAWDYSCLPAERRGVFVGTRELFTPFRNHLLAVTTAIRVARRVGTHVTVINPDRSKGRRILDALGKGVPADGFRIIDCRLPYHEYLRQISWHRVVFQLDRGAVPGQVAGDALLCRSLCVGGNSAIEQIAFPNESHPTLTERDAEIHLETLLTDDSAYRTALEVSWQRVLKSLSFAAVQGRLREAMETGAKK